jgi:TolA-binding protein
VHGTSFRVSIVAAEPACGEGTLTRVDVYEGVVAVRYHAHEALVRAGERWPAGCGDTGASGASGASASASVVASSTARASAAATRPPTSSELAAQNDLFREAIAAKRHGDTAEALATLDRFVAKYPNAPLAESAAVERMKLLAEAGDRPRAEAAARDYLARYPSGSARTDADALLRRAP